MSDDLLKLVMSDDLLKPVMSDDLLKLVVQLELKTNCMPGFYFFGSSSSLSLSCWCLSASSSCTSSHKRIFPYCLVVVLVATSANQFRQKLEQAGFPVARPRHHQLCNPPSAYICNERLSLSLAQLPELGSHWLSTAASSPACCGLPS